MRHGALTKECRKLAAERVTSHRNSPDAQRRGKCDDVQGRQPADGSREARLSTMAGIAGSRVSGGPNEKNAKKQLDWMCA